MLAGTGPTYPQLNQKWAGAASLKHAYFSQYFSLPGQGPKQVLPEVKWELVELCWDLWSTGLLSQNQPDHKAADWA